MSGSTSTSNDSAEIAQKLSLKYDDVFNKNYDKVNKLTSQISTNDDLIRTYNQDNFKIDIQNAVLQIIAVATVIIFVAVLLFKFGLFGSATLLMTIIASIVVLAMLFIYFTYYSSDYNAYLDRISRDTGKKMENQDEPTKDDLNCDLYEDEGGATIRSTSTEILNYDVSSKNALLKSDSDYNVWLDGDHKSSNKINENTTRYVDSKYGEDVKGKFNSISPDAATYYDCRFKGADFNGDPLKKDILKTTVPCKYFIDYEEVGKYTKSGSTFTKI
jgi:Predicted membrane protein (DUF2207)